MKFVVISTAIFVSLVLQPAAISARFERNIARISVKSDKMNRALLQSMYTPPINQGGGFFVVSSKPLAMSRYHGLILLLVITVNARFGISENHRRENRDKNCAKNHRYK